MRAPTRFAAPPVRRTAHPRPVSLVLTWLLNDLPHLCRTRSCGHDCRGRSHAASRLSWDASE